MKIKQLFLGGAILVIASAISFTGCRKEKSADDKDTSGAADNALADKSFEDIGQISNEAAKGGVTSYKSADYDGLLSSCVTLTFDTINHADADSITVNFGSVNCLCNDNRYRRGKLYITYTSGKHYWDSTADVTIKTAPTDNYYVNDNQVKGTKNIHNNGHISGHMNWSINVNGTIVKANGQGTVTWTSSRTREWLAGEGTSQWIDDVYGITGSANGTSASGTPFSTQITSQLIRKISCIRWFVAGTFDFTPGTKPTRHVDFSPPNNGSCDNIATVTINNNVYTIYMN